MPKERLAAQTISSTAKLTVAAGPGRHTRDRRRGPSSRHRGSVVGVLEARGRAHDAVLVGAAFVVAGAVEREQHVLAELGRFLRIAWIRSAVASSIARQLRSWRRRAPRSARTACRSAVPCRRPSFPPDLVFFSLLPRDRRPCRAAAARRPSTSRNSAICVRRSRSLASSSPTCCQLLRTIARSCCTPDRSA